MEPTQIEEMYGSLIEAGKRAQEELANRIEAMERGQKKFRHKPTNITPKKKKRKKK